jgi:segregation and condensation protein A
VRMIGSIAEWTPIDVFLSPFLVTDDMRATITASSFSASLELVKEGKIDLRQTEPFAPLYMRDRKTVVPVTTEAGNG